MKFVRDHRAEWLPSRHRYALSKLIAYAVYQYRRAGDGERQADHATNGPSTSMAMRYAFAVSRDQSTAEVFTVAALVFFAAAADLAALLPLPLWVSIPLALVLTPWLLQVPLYVAGIPFGNEKVNSVFILSTVVIASSWVGTMQTPLRFVVWVLFAALALNAAAWVPARLLRRRMQALEQECGV